MRMLAAWGSATCHPPAGDLRRFQDDLVIRSPLSEGHTLVPLRMAAVRDAVCSVERGAEPRGVRAAAWRRWPLCLCQWNMVGGISAPTELESREASLSASTQGTHPGEGGSGAENQPPSANEARALAWQGLVWVASGMLWGEYVDERAWGLDTLLTSTWGGGGRSAQQQPSPSLNNQTLFSKRILCFEQLQQSNVPQGIA